MGLTCVRLASHASFESTKSPLPFFFLFPLFFALDFFFKAFAFRYPGCHGCWFERVFVHER